MPIFNEGQAAGRPGMGPPQMNETYTGPKPAMGRGIGAMGPPPPRPAGIAGPEGAGPMPQQRGQAQFGGGRPPPPNMPPPGGGLQAAGFAPRQAPPVGQFAQRFPGAQAPRTPPMGGGAFGMRPPPGGGAQFGAPTKQPMMTGQFPRMGGGMTSPFGSQR
jgi:hypothetical protein